MRFSSEHNSTPLASEESESIFGRHDQAVNRERIEDWVDEDGHRFMRYIETLPNGVRHPIIEEGDSYPLDNTEVFTVPEESYFAMGDNRDHASDSREWPHDPLRARGEPGRPCLLHLLLDGR